MLALGIVQIIAGAIAIAVPVVASLAAVAVFGAVLILSAIAQLTYAFKIKAWPRSAWYGLGGALYAIAGLLVILYPIGGALTLALIIAVLLIAEGGLRVIFAAVVRPAAGWGWLTAAGDRQHHCRRHSVAGLAPHRVLGDWPVARYQFDIQRDDERRRGHYCPQAPISRHLRCQPLNVLR